MNKQKAMEIKTALEEMIEMAPYMYEFEQQIAKQLKARYDSLIQAGFTSAESIEICKGEYK